MSTIHRLVPTLAVTAVCIAALACAMAAGRGAL